MLPEIENAAVQIRRLSIGDYQIGSPVIVERRTLKDFAVSIIDDRRLKQMIYPANSEGVLILEGSGEDLLGIEVEREAMREARSGAANHVNRSNNPC